jgi:hypothetical protein
MRKTFKVTRSDGRKYWIVQRINPGELFPTEFRAFDYDAEFRRLSAGTAMLHIDNALQMLVAVDWLLERDWELDLSRCDKAFLAVYPVTAEATA